jgi:tRNA-splicing ligase RtcB (3'-phosphate/5'-hydroxy nucleic acid ligase)
VRSRLRQLMGALGHRVPAGTGAGGIWKADDQQLGRVLRTGARAAVEAGYGNSEEIERCEDWGGLPVDDLREASDRATQRGLGQLGSLGSENQGRRRGGSQLCRGRPV